MATSQNCRVVQYPATPIEFRVSASRNAADATDYGPVVATFFEQELFGQLRMCIILITAQNNGEGALI
jgi:hypothetical protein